MPPPKNAGSPYTTNSKLKYPKAGSKSAKFSRMVSPPKMSGVSKPWEGSARSRAGMSGFKGPSVGKPKIPRERY